MPDIPLAAVAPPIPAGGDGAARDAAALAVAIERLRGAAWGMAALQAENLRLAARVEGLRRVAAGWQALVEASGVVALAIDGKGVIRWLTPPVVAILSRAPPGAGLPDPGPADPGLPGAGPPDPGAAAPASAGPVLPVPGQRLAEVTCHLDQFDLAAAARAVLDARQPAERRVTAHGGTAAWLMRLVPDIGPDGQADGVVASFVDADRQARDETHATLMEELNHRIRNMAQVVLSLADSTRRRATSLEDFGRSFAGRILAMGRTQDMVVRSGWTGVPLRDLVLRQLEPYATAPGCLMVEGPAVRLTPKAAFALDLVLHEMTTNAAKHGALSAAGGQLRVTWAREAPAGRPALVLRWLEIGGPPVAPRPERRGFGSELIARQARHGLGGEVALDFAAAGLRATLVLPLAVIAGGRAPA